MSLEETSVLEPREHVWLGIVEVPSAHEDVERAEGAEGRFAFEELSLCQYVYRLVSRPEERNNDEPIKSWPNKPSQNFTCSPLPTE